MNNSLRILYWNCRSIRTKKIEITHLAKGADIVVCVETWLRPEIDFQLPGFHSVRKDRQHLHGGGIAIFIAKHLKYIPLNNLGIADGHTETCCIQITNVSENTTIAACYRPPSNKITESHWDAFIQSLQDIGPFIIMGDCNAQHSEWNCSKIDSPGRTLIQILDKHEITIINHDTSSHFDARNGSFNNLDLVLTYGSIGEETTVFQEEEPFGSDHFPLHITINICKNIYRRKNNRISSQRTDWEAYTAKMDYQLESSMLAMETSSTDKYNHFVQGMTQAVLECTPKKSSGHTYAHRNPVPWWGQECDRSVRIRKARFKTWQHQSTTNNWFLYKKQVALTKKLIKKKKRENLPPTSPTKLHSPTSGTTSGYLKTSGHPRRTKKVQTLSYSRKILTKPQTNSPLLGFQ
ncbi:uncharacterized protein LOC143358164 [Halictus rubicundus]|uniref:uncharacterized protein LOC143358164 n=1 Tax=Halictus rubicundus TaxID=77578 RepID=UPI004035DCEB